LPPFFGYIIDPHQSAEALDKPLRVTAKSGARLIIWPLDVRRALRHGYNLARRISEPIGVVAMRSAFD
jgi:hypothetical protein